MRGLPKFHIEGETLKKLIRTAQPAPAPQAQQPAQAPPAGAPTQAPAQFSLSKDVAPKSYNDLIRKFPQVANTVAWLNKALLNKNDLTPDVESQVRAQKANLIGASKHARSAQVPYRIQYT